MFSYILPNWCFVIFFGCSDVKFHSAMVGYSVSFLFVSHAVLRADSAQALQGIISMSQELCKAKDIANAQLLARSVAIHAIQAMDQCPTNRSDTYRQLGWALVDAHSCVLEASIAAGKESKLQLAERCSRLIAVMKCCGIPATDNALIALQVKVSRLLCLAMCILFSTHFWPRKVVSKETLHSGLLELSCG